MYKYWTSDNSRLILVTTMEVIRSNKGKPKLLFENYAYLIKHQKNYINWYCVKEGISCKGGIKTTNDRVLGRKSVRQFLRGVGYNIRCKAINREHQEGETV